MSAVASARVAGRASARVVARRARSSALPSSCGRVALPAQRRASRLVVRAEAEKPTTTTPTDGAAEVDKLVKDLQEKWDAIDNKTSVIVYSGAAIVTLWLANTVVGAINTVPLLPKLLELVGLGYTAWFVYRYLLFKSSREELLQDVEELKKKIGGNE